MTIIGASARAEKREACDVFRKNGPKVHKKWLWAWLGLKIEDEMGPRPKQRMKWSQNGKTLA